MDIIKILLKHLVYEACLNTFFAQVFDNFVKPKIIPCLRGRALKAKYTLDCCQYDELIPVHGTDIDKLLLKAFHEELRLEGLLQKT